MTSPYAFFQFWLNAEDAIVGHPAAGLHLPQPRGDRGAGGVGPRAAAPARGPAGARPGRHDAWCTARRRPSGWRRRPGRCSAGATRPSWPRWTPGPCATPPPSCRRRPAQVGDQLVDLLAATGLVAGRNAARRAIAEGGAYLNNVKVTDPERVLRPSGPAAGRGRPAPARAAARWPRSPSAALGLSPERGSRIRRGRSAPGRCRATAREVLLLVLEPQQ